VIAGGGLDDAVALAREAPGRAQQIGAFEEACWAVVHDRTLALAGDDRSALYISLLEARRDAGDEAGKDRVAAEWSAFLDSMAVHAKTKAARVVYDPHRLSAYLELGHPERAIPMLEQTKRDFPDDYNPYARLAIAYRGMKHWDEGLAASDRAMALAYGPRKVGFFGTRADLYLGKADTLAAERTLETAIAYADSLPEGQRSSGAIASLKKKLETLKHPARP